MTVDAILLRRVHRAMLQTWRQVMPSLTTWGRNLPSSIPSPFRNRFKRIEGFVELMDAVRPCCAHFVFKPNRFPHDYVSFVRSALSGIVSVLHEYSSNEYPNHAEHLQTLTQLESIHLRKLAEYCPGWANLCHQRYGRRPPSTPHYIKAVNLLDVALSVLNRNGLNRAVAHTRGVQIACNEKDISSLKEAFVDGHQIHIALDNILHNGVLYATPSSTVFLRGVSRDDSTFGGYEVENRGLGILPSDLSQVFDLGYRGSRASELAPGVGLGLTIVKELVEQTGGRVEITSTSTGENDFLTRVTILFPTTGPKESFALALGAHHQRINPLRACARIPLRLRVREHASRARPAENTSVAELTMLRGTLLSMLDIADRIEAVLTELDQRFSHMLRAEPLPMGAQKELQNARGNLGRIRRKIKESRARCEYFGGRLRQVSRDYLGALSGCLAVDMGSIEMSSLLLAVAYQHGVGNELDELRMHLRGLRNLLLLAWGNLNTHLDLTRADHRARLERLARNRVSINLPGVLLDTIYDYCAVARAGGIEIVFDNAEITALPDVFAEEYCVEVVTANLLCNAIHYGSSLSITAIREERSTDSSSCGYTIESRGPGIRPSELRRVFEKGYRGSHARSARPGAGLGLFIVKEFVELYGGRVEISSTPVDREIFLTRVTVLLQVAARELSAASPDRQEPDA